MTNALIALPTNTNAPLTMSSREIAELLDVRHDNVKRTIERLADREVITLPPLEEVSNEGFGPKSTTEYHVGKRDSYIIVAQLSPEFTAALVDRWQALENAAKPALPVTYLDALRAYLASEEKAAVLQLENAKQAEALAIAVPKADYYDQLSPAFVISFGLSFKTSFWNT